MRGICVPTYDNKVGPAIWNVSMFKRPFFHGDLGIIDGPTELLSHSFTWEERLDYMRFIDSSRTWFDGTKFTQH
jgi:hypothetical protein